MISGFGYSGYTFRMALGLGADLLVWTVADGALPINNG